MQEIKLKVSMHCATCVGNIDRELAKHGVTAQSNAALKTTKVRFDEQQITREEIVTILKKIGYKAHEA